MIVFGCGGSKSAPVPLAAPTASHSPKPAEPAKIASEAERIALFDRLVATARRYHVFSPNTEKNLGKTWDSSLPKLREEFAAARTADELQVALTHFGNSLHDVHCTFRPAERSGSLSLHLSVEVEKVNGRLQFYVKSISKKENELRQLLSPGDILESVDGVGASDLVSKYEFESHMNDWDLIALDVARFLTWRRVPRSVLPSGATSTWVVRPRNGGPTKTVTLTWGQGGSDENTDFALDFSAGDCGNWESKNYGPYALTHRGYRACIYTSTAPGYRDYPIVRQTSFQYDVYPHGPLADHEMIQSVIAKEHPKGVILDLQENGGGMNPNLFLDWWAKKPYTDNETHMVLDADLAGRGGKNETVPSADNLPRAVQEWYAKELEQREAGKRFTHGRPFMCKAETCFWDNRYTPSHRVTNVPFAVLVGPGCASSCDAFVWHVGHNHFGTLVGRRPMAGFTTHRTHMSVTLHDGAPTLGRLDFASSFDSPAGSIESIEGKSVDLDAPIAMTFENHDRYDRVLVDAAIQSLKKR